MTDRFYPDNAMPWDSNSNRHYEPVELRAAKIYERMDYDGPGKKPDWVPNGNALKQDEARYRARCLLREAGHTPLLATPTGGEVLTVETMREAVQSAVDAVAFPISRRSADTEGAPHWQARPPHCDWRRIAPEFVDDYRAKDWEVRFTGAAQSGRNDALRLLADLFTEAEHETWRKEEIVNIIEDARHALRGAGKDRGGCSMPQGERQ